MKSAAARCCEDYPNAANETTSDFGVVACFVDVA
jgi:hypothetical protein